MAMKLSDFKKLIQFCKHIGVKRLKFDNTEVEFMEKPAKIKQVTFPLDGVVPRIEGMPTEDQLLYHSTDYDPTLREDEHSVR